MTMLRNPRIIKGAFLAVPLLAALALTPNAMAAEPCDLIITETHITDNGDGDGFADTNETLRIGFTVESRCAFGPKNCVARLQTDSPAVDCSRRQEFLVRNLPSTPPRSRWT